MKIYILFGLMCVMLENDNYYAMKTRYLLKNYILCRLYGKTFCHSNLVLKVLYFSINYVNTKLKRR